jgi:SOS-response transcriptional repressor LexA
MSDSYRQLLGYIKEHKEDHAGKSPTYEEMQKFLNAPSRNAIARLMVSMERKGLISRRVGRAQSVYLTDEGFAVLRGTRVEASNG